MARPMGLHETVGLIEYRCTAVSLYRCISESLLRQIGFGLRRSVAKKRAASAPFLGEPLTCCQ